MFSSTGIAQLISFAIIPFLARLYTPSEHGALTLFTSFVAVCVAFTSLRYDQAIIVEENRSRARHLAFLSFFLNIGWCIVFYLIIIFFKKNILSIFNIEGNGLWLYWVPLTILFAAFTEILVLWFNRDRSYNKLAANRVFGMVGGSAYKLSHPFLRVITGNGLILGQVFGQAMQMILLAPLKKINQLKIERKLIRHVASDYKAFPKLATPSALINIVGSFMPVFIISAMISEEMTGFYGNGIKLTFIPLSAISYAVGQVFFERLARLKNNDLERKKLARQLLHFLFWLSVIPVVIIMIWGDAIIPFILGEGWNLSGKIGQVTVVFFFVIYLTGPFSAAFEVYSGLGRQLWFTATFTLLTTAALFLVYTFTQNVIFALIAHAFIGIIIRLAMLYDCFKLMGMKIYISILKGILVLGGLTLLALAIKILLN